MLLAAAIHLELKEQAMARKTTSQNECVSAVAAAAATSIKLAMATALYENNNACNINRQNSIVLVLYVRDTASLSLPPSIYL